MKTIARYLDNDNTAFDGSYVSTLIRPTQVFVKGFVGHDAAKKVASGLLEADTILPIVNAFTLTQGSDTATAISTIIAASDNNVVQNIYVLVSSTQTVMPTSAEIKVLGTQIPGNSSSYSATGLSANTTYYGWAMAVDGSGNESVIVASTPPVLMTTPFIFINEGVLDPRITFTRASTATRVNSLGLIEIVEVDIPRLDYDPVTLAQKGILIEESRTNALVRSNDFSTTWARSTVRTKTIEYLT